MPTVLLQQWETARLRCPLPWSRLQSHILAEQLPCLPKAAKGDGRESRAQAEWQPRPKLALRGGVAARSAARRTRRGGGGAQVVVRLARGTRTACGAAACALLQWRRPVLRSRGEGLRQVGRVYDHARVPRRPHDACRWPLAPPMRVVSVDASADEQGPRGPPCASARPSGEVKREWARREPVDEGRRRQEWR
eukprot:scaffold73313_cov27-Tisochrysis_lutea.AAC.11